VGGLCGSQTLTRLIAPARMSAAARRSADASGRYCDITDTKCDARVVTSWRQVRVVRKHEGKALRDH